jgi:hypothetical protein
LRGGRLAVTSSIGHLSVADKIKHLAVTLWNERVSITKSLLAMLVSSSLAAAPICAGLPRSAPSSTPIAPTTHLSRASPKHGKKHHFLNVISRQESIR